MGVRASKSKTTWESQNKNLLDNNGKAKTNELSYITQDKQKAPISMKSTSVTSKEHGTILPSLTNKQSPAAIDV